MTHGLLFIRLYKGTDRFDTIRSLYLYSLRAYCLVEKQLHCSVGNKNIVLTF